MSLFQTLETNPFERSYHVKELETFKLKESNYKNIKLKVTDASGRIDGYMYMDFVTELKNIPILYINNELWMSITPMEIESHFMPILKAFGRVGVGGLGLGYYTQKILKNEDVEEVIVYELDKNVIDFYYHNFGSHPKLTIIQQDVRTINDEFFDFFYCDIYPQQMDLKAIEDMALLTENNNISDYHFWTMEHMLLELIQAGYKDEIPLRWQIDYFPFLQKFLDTKGNMANIMGIGDDIYEKLLEYDI